VQSHAINAAKKWASAATKFVMPSVRLVEVVHSALERSSHVLSRFAFSWPSSFAWFQVEQVSMGISLKKNRTVIQIHLSSAW